MKKILSLILVLGMTFSLVACGSGEAPEAPAASEGEEASSAETAEAESLGGDESADGKNQIALLISSVSSLDDKAFNTAYWVGMNRFCDENPEYTCTYFQPTEDTVEAQVSICDAAVAGGAEFIVVAADQFKVSLLEMSRAYPDVKFLSIEAAPQTIDGEVSIEDNVQVVTYKAEQSGFFAGYAAVREGYRSLGTIGGMAVPGVIQYMYGFVKGADVAAEEMGLDDVTVKYTYAGNFEASPENQAKAAAWYQSGTEVIFAVAGVMNNSIFAAAEENGDVVAMGCDANQNEISERIVTSALKDTENTTYNGLVAWKDGTMETGKTVELGSAEQACGLAMDGARFQNFTQEEYESLFERVANNENGIADSIPDDSAYEDPTQIPVNAITLDFIK